MIIKNTILLVQQQKVGVLKTQHEAAPRRFPPPSTLAGALAPSGTVRDTRMCSTAFQSQRLCSMQGLGATELVRPAFRPAPSQPTHTHTHAEQPMSSSQHMCLEFPSRRVHRQKNHPTRGPAGQPRPCPCFQRDTQRLGFKQGAMFIVRLPQRLCQKNGWVLSPRWGSTVTSWPRILTRGSTCTKTLNSFCRNPPHFNLQMHFCN